MCADGFCIPIVKLKVGIKYVSYQYTLMSLFMNKFKSHLDKNRDMYFNYGVAISNLIKARNMFLENNKLLIINNTIFSEFRISCAGSAVSSMRTSQLRIIGRISKGARPKFRYVPEDFLKKSTEDQNKIIENNFKKWKFPNVSGNIIGSDPKYAKNMRFRLTEEKSLVINSTKEIVEEASESELDSESDIEPVTEI